MAISARPAKDLPAAAIVARVDMRGGTPVRAGTYPFDGHDVVTGWHTHDLHQIEYAFEGVVEVETHDAHFLLPPQQAIWIPAGLPHNTTLRRVRTVSVFFEAGMLTGVSRRARVLAAVPVLREMILYATRWPIDRVGGDPVADDYFAVMAQLTREWLDQEAPLALPTTSDPVLQAVMAVTDAHLDDATVGAVCHEVGLSPRTLRRRFVAATGITWRDYLHHSRLLRAMALLAEPGPSVRDVATTVGFDSVSAFARAFALLTGETPSAYRRRVTDAPAR